MTADHYFAEIAERGWLVSNLFQLDSGLWQANLRTASRHTEFGFGATPSEALATAIDLIESSASTPPAQETCARIGDLPPIDIFSLMAGNLRTDPPLRIKVKL